MQLEFRLIEDDNLWDEYVLKLPIYSFLNSSARHRYNESVGAKSFRYAIFNKEQYLGIVLLSVGFSKIFGHFLECKHSPILLNSRVEYWEEILSFCRKVGKENNCFLVRFAPLYRENEELKNFYSKNSLIKAPIHNVDALISQQIDLRKDLEELRRDMNKTKRNLLNRLLKDENALVKVFTDDSQFEIFEDFHNQTTKLKGYRDKPVRLLLAELREQISKGMCYMLIGYYNSKPIGIWQCTVYGKHMHLYQAGTDTKFRDKNINISYLLFWEALKLGKELGCEVLDLFGGVVPMQYEGKKHPWKGVNDFKQSLGGQKVTYMHSRDYPLNKLKYYIYYIYSWLITTVKGYTIKW
jgi:hypothetical protein